MELKNANSVRRQTQALPLKAAIARKAVVVGAANPDRSTDSLASPAPAAEQRATRPPAADSDEKPLQCHRAAGGAQRASRRSPDTASQSVRTKGSEGRMDTDPERR